MIHFRQSTLLIAFAAIPTYASGQVSLDQATVWVRSYRANDAVYDRFRDVLYASIYQDGDGTTENTIAVIDVDTGQVIHSEPTMIEPGILGITADGSRVYFGVDSQYGFRHYEPETHRIGEFFELLPYSTSNAIAMQFAAHPLDPSIVAVLHGFNSRQFCVYDRDGFVDCNGYNFNAISFADADTLIANTSSEVSAFSILGSGIMQVDRIDGITGIGAAESKGGKVYSTGGRVFDPSGRDIEDETGFAMLGTFSTTAGAVEPVPELGITYYLDGNILRVFDNETFLELDSRALSISTFAVSDLFVAGEGKLGFVKGSSVGIISGIPVPAPCLIDRTNDSILDDSDITAFTNSLDAMSPSADLNQDGLWDVHDLSAFIDAFKAGCPK